MASNIVPYIGKDALALRVLGQVKTLEELFKEFLTEYVGLNGDIIAQLSNSLFNPIPNNYLCYEKRYWLTIKRLWREQLKEFRRQNQLTALQVV